MDSLADLAGLPWQGIGLSGLVTLAIIYVFTGRLVPKSVYDKMEASKDREIERWMQVAQRAETLADSQSQQITQLLEGGRTTVSVVEAIQQTAVSSTEVRGQ